MRNDATTPQGSSGLSPYLHFGVIGPREVMAAVDGAKATLANKDKFADKILSWRAWFHYRAATLASPERHDAYPGGRATR